MIFEALFPKEEYDRVQNVQFARLYDAGYRGIIFDIDNTLVPHNAGPTAEIVAFLKGLMQMGYRICLLSNNQEPRVASFNAPIGADYIYKANKPSVKGYEAAAGKMGTTLDTTLFVGDQLFTDIWGANRTGIYSILVHPIHPKEEIQIVLKRRLEKPILWLYHRSRRRKEAMTATDRTKKQ